MKDKKFTFNHIGIKNFKSWKHEAFLPIEDINLVFGPNSSGKSSVIQAFILLNQSCKGYDEETPAIAPFNNLQLINKYRDHGSIADIVNGGIKNITEKVEFTFRTDHIEKVMIDFLGFLRKNRKLDTVRTRSISRRHMDPSNAGTFGEFYYDIDEANKHQLEELKGILPDHLEFIDLRLSFVRGTLSGAKIFFNDDEIANVSCSDGLFHKSIMTENTKFWQKVLAAGDSKTLNSSFFKIYIAKADAALTGMQDLYDDLIYILKRHRLEIASLQSGNPELDLYARVQMEQDFGREERLRSAKSEGEKSFKLANNLLIEQLKSLLSESLTLPMTASELSNHVRLLFNIFNGRIYSGGPGGGMSGGFNELEELTSKLFAADTLTAPFFHANRKVKTTKPKSFKKYSEMYFKIRRNLQNLRYLLNNKEWKYNRFEAARSFALKELRTIFKSNKRRVPIKRLEKNMSAYNEFIRDKICTTRDLKTLLTENRGLFASSINLGAFNLRDGQEASRDEQEAFFDEDYFEGFKEFKETKESRAKSQSFKHQCISIGTQYQLCIENIIKLIECLQDMGKELQALSTRFSAASNVNLKKFTKNLNRKKITVPNFLSLVPYEDLPIRDMRLDDDFQQITRTSDLHFYLDVFRNHGSDDRMPSERHHTNIFTFLRHLVYTLAEDVKKIQWIGPHRQPPNRYIRDVNSLGTSEYEEILKMSSNPFMTELFNQALFNLEIPYQLYQGAHDPAQGLTHREVRLIDNNGNTVSILDVGYGVSQVLPIIFKCFSSRGKIILIEQPELHLHPKLQANLADLFAISALFFDNTFILETHSENLMLRYQRRLRDKTLGQGTYELLGIKRKILSRVAFKDKDLRELKEIFRETDFYDKLFHSLTEEKIKIQPLAISMDKRKKTSFCKKIKLTDDGEFIGEWPDGFFDERFDEIGI